MRPTRASLAARLAKLENQHAPTLALTAEVRVFFADGQRLDHGTRLTRPGAIHAVVNVTVAGPLVHEPYAVELQPDVSAPLFASDTVPAKRAPTPKAPATAADPWPSIVAEGPLVLGGPGDQLVGFHEALARTKLRVKGAWRGDD